MDRSSDDLVDFRVAHLGMIQGVISRMSGFSAATKNFAVTLSAAIVAIAFDKQASMLVAAALAAVIVLALMDGYYHNLEVRFRELYQTVVERPIEEGANMSLDPPAATWRSLKKVLKSVSFLPFYVPLLFALVIALKVAAHDGATQAQPDAISDTGSARQEEPSEKRAGGIPRLPGTDDKRLSELNGTR